LKKPPTINVLTVASPSSMKVVVIYVKTAGSAIAVKTGKTKLQKR